MAEGWQERLVAEYEDLKEKFEKLTAFTENEEAMAALDVADRRLLLEQKRAMLLYKNALFERVRRL